MRLNLLLTGNELMGGDIVDSNSAMIARHIAPHGWGIHKKLTIGDDLALLVDSLRTLAADCDVLLVNGGLGPTIDDLTAQALAQACAQPLVEHPQAIAHLETWCARIGIALNAANRKQALLPQGCRIVPNPTGSAVGFECRLGACQVICTPGVPRELEPMLLEHILPGLARQFGSGSVEVMRLTLFGIGESSLQQRLADTRQDWPEGIELGFRAGFPILELKLSVREPQHLPRARRLLAELKVELAEYVVGEGAVSLPERIVALLRERGQYLTLAESCTGGLIASQVTRVPGASAVFEAGFVTYSNTMKQQLLGVDAKDLEREGAVSETVVRQMASGALRASAADYAIAVSGIAGPDGGSEEKPVGTVWLAWGSRQRLHTRRLNVRLPRQQFQELVSAMALDLVRREIQGLEPPENYFRDRR